MDRNSARIVELDVREHLRKKLEPFQIIMDTVKTLEPDDIFVLHATFKPTPLFGVLKLRRLVGKAERIDHEHWISTFVHKRNKNWLDDVEAASVLAITADTDTREDQSNTKSIELDNRGLEPPKPMMRTLAALDRCHSGDEVVIHNDRVPMFLIEELRALGYPYRVEEQSDGTTKAFIQKI